MHTLLYRNVISSYLIVIVIVLQVDTYGNILVCVHGFEFFNGQVIMLNVIFINATIINYCDLPCGKGNSMLHNTLPLKTKENQVWHTSKACKSTLK